MNSISRNSDTTWRLLFAYLLHVIVIAAVSGGTYYLAYYLMTHKPEANKKRFERQILVKTVTASVSNHHTVIAAMGTVVPSQQIDILPEIDGKLKTVSNSLVPGGFFPRGEEIAQIDPEEETRNVQHAKESLAASETRLAKVRQDILVTEQRLALNKRRADVAYTSAQAKAKETQARLDRLRQLGKISSQEEYDAAEATAIQNATELENAKIRREELKVEEVALELKRLDVKLAESQLELDKIAIADAQKRLRDTRVVAPCDALVLQKYVGTGSMVTPSTKLASLVSVDEYWIETALTIDRLDWLTIPQNEKDKGSTAKITNFSWQEGQFREGHVKRLSPALESEGRMAKLLIAVEDPLDREAKGRPRLLLGSFVRVSIGGKSLKDVVCVRREYLHGGNCVWIYDSGKLDVRQVEVAWNEVDFVYVRGVKDGEKIIVSEIPGAVPGMKIEELP